MTMNAVVDWRRENIPHLHSSYQIFIQNEVKKMFLKARKVNVQPSYDSEQTPSSKAVRFGTPRYFADDASILAI